VNYFNKTPRYLMIASTSFFASFLQADAVVEEGLYRNNLKNRFLTASALPRNSSLHSSLVLEQWSLAPDKNFEEPSCQKPNSSCCFGIQDAKYVYEAIFESSIFDHYYLQIAEKAVHLKHLSEDIKTLLAIPSQTPEEKRVLHEILLRVLRNKLDKRETLKPNEQEDLDTLSFYLLADAHVFPQQSDIMAEYLDLSDEFIQSKPLSQHVDDAFAKLEAVFSSTSQYQKKDPNYFDLHLDGFLPTPLFSIDSSQYLYMFNPMIQDKRSKKNTINPIFISYLRHLKKNNQKHLYINVQSRIGELEELAESAEFKGTFFIATFNKDDDFYYQENAWELKSDASQFKKNLMQSFCECEERVQWPQELLLNNWYAKLPSIFDQIHAEHFHNAPNLDAEKRGIFVEIACARLVQEIRNFYKPDYINATCAYTMDRGPGQYAADYVYELFEKNGQLTVKEKRSLLTLYFISPIISQNRPSHEYRVIRLSAMLRVLFQDDTSVVEEFERKRPVQFF